MNRSLLRIISIVVVTAPLISCHSAPSSTREASAPVGVIVDATALASAFEAHEPDAIELYSGKRGRIKGVFAKIEQLADGQVAVTFKTSIDTFRPIRCIFDSSASNALDRLAAGDEMTVTGRIVGFAESRYFVTVDECLIDR